MATPDELRAHFELAEQLIAGASKEDIAEAARLLAMNLAHYRLRYEDLPLENFVDMMQAQSVDAETAKVLAAGMEQLVASSVSSWAWTKTISRPTFTSLLAFLLVLPWRVSEAGKALTMCGSWGAI